MMDISLDFKFSKFYGQRETSRGGEASRSGQDFLDVDIENR